MDAFLAQLPDGTFIVFRIGESEPEFEGKEMVDAFSFAINKVGEGNVHLLGPKWSIKRGGVFVQPHCGSRPSVIKPIPIKPGPGPKGFTCKWQSGVDPGYLFIEIQGDKSKYEK